VKQKSVTFNNGQDLSKLSYEQVSEEELVEAFSSILNIEKEKLQGNSHILKNINPHIKNIMYYLGQMKGEQMLISASQSVEFVLNFNKSALTN
jgi:hypothetical protein